MLELGVLDTVVLMVSRLCVVVDGTVDEVVMTGIDVVADLN